MGRQKPSLASVLVITSCTGQKTVSHREQLTWEDFILGTQHVARRERGLGNTLRAAECLYAGQQHVRLRRGLQVAREKGTLDIDLRIVSAGYGVVTASKQLAPYECTFSGLKKSEIVARAQKLDIPRTIAELLSRKYDLVLILLGDDYLHACAGEGSLTTASPTIAFCGTDGERKFASSPYLHTLVLGNLQAREFSCPLVGLKGELGGRLLSYLSDHPEKVSKVTRGTAEALFRILAKTPLPQLHVSSAEIDLSRQVIGISKSWLRQSQQKKLRYFIPDWDDRVDPEYDFAKDEQSNGLGSWAQDAYAHELYKTPNYDGLLVSKIVAEQGDRKRELINALGVHRFLRVPKDFPVMGDCGAFGYVEEAQPPFSTADVVDYYTRLGFDYGVSVDHLILSHDDGERRARYELTIENAREFLRQHRATGAGWTPIGAVQGWSPETYAKAADQYLKMGYKYIALGGLVRSTTPEILQILQEVHERLRPGVRLHLFGLARFRAVKQLVQLGVTSIDSASMLRKAWLGSNTNYLTDEGWYSAIRVPQIAASFRAKQAIDNGAKSDNVARLERICLNGLHRFGCARNSRVGSDLLDALVELDFVITGKHRAGIRTSILRTLEDRPWERCGCEICSAIGIDVVIFRGNNRNRRRGFHNTYVFYRIIDRLLGGERIPWLEKDRKVLVNGAQRTLFSST